MRVRSRKAPSPQYPPEGIRLQPAGGLFHYSRRAGAGVYIQRCCRWRDMPERYKTYRCRGVTVVGHTVRLRDAGCLGRHAQPPARDYGDHRPRWGCRSGKGRSRTALTRRKSVGRLVGAFRTVSTKRINEQRGTPGAVVWQRLL